MISLIARTAQRYSIEIFRRPSIHYAPVDGIRALSMLGVMAYHCFFLLRLYLPADQFKAFVLQTPWYIGWVWNLDYTVDAFFVLSGFLIASLLFREHSQRGSINLQRFYWRRYLRLTPAYFAFIGLYLLLSPRPEPHLWTNILYLNNFISVAEMSLPWTWTLAVEEQFYLIFPLVLSLFVLRARRPLVNLVMMLVVAILLSLGVVANDAELWNRPYKEMFFDIAAFTHYFDRVYVNLHTRFGPFVCGTLAAYVACYHSHALSQFRLRFWWFNGVSLLASVVLLGLLYANPYQGEGTQLSSRLHLVIHRIAFGVALAWVMLATLGAAGILEPLRRFLSWKLWYPFAQLSYSMYLLHYLIVVLLLSNLVANLKHFGMLDLDKIFPYQWLAVTYLLAIIISFPLSMVMCIVVEKPFMHMRDWLGGKRMRTSSVPA